MSRTRLAKEFRPLLLPWCVAAAAACLLPLFALLDDRSGIGVAQFFSTLSFLAFFGSITVLAGISFGAEFQERTFGLLISQPVERARLWREKLLTLVLGVATVSIILWGTHTLLIQPRFLQALFRIHDSSVLAGWSSYTAVRQGFPLEPVHGVFILGTICSAGFWTIITRSTIGGIVFSVASQFLAVLGVSGAALALQKVFGVELPFEHPGVAGDILVGIGVLIYCAIFLWLGWRRFATLELREGAFGEGTSLSGRLAVSTRWLDWLCCRPKGALRNLVRKELMLQQPVFLIAVVFSLCWLLTLAVSFVAPARHEIFEIIFNVLTVVYVALLSVLIGCVSLGEEKMLGLTAWHLTVPVSARRQWMVKLGVSVIVAAALGFTLPCLLAWLAAPKAYVGFLYALHDKEGTGPEWILLMCGLTFVLSFWAATLQPNTIRSALTTVISLPVLGVCVALGVWFAERFEELGTLLILPFAAHLPPAALAKLGDSDPIPVFAIALVVPVALVQSLTQFRRVRGRSAGAIKYSLILAALVFFGSFCGAGFARAARGFYGRVQEDVLEALQALPPNESILLPGRPPVVTVQELERTGKLSYATRAWLRNGLVSLSPEPSGQAEGKPVYMVWIKSPKCGMLAFPYSMAQPSAKPGASHGAPNQNNGTKP